MRMFPVGRPQLLASHPDNRWKTWYHNAGVLLAASPTAVMGESASWTNFSVPKRWERHLGGGTNRGMLRHPLESSVATSSLNFHTVQLACIYLGQRQQGLEKSPVGVTSSTPLSSNVSLMAVILKATSAGKDVSRFAAKMSSLLGVITRELVNCLNGIPTTCSKTSFQPSLKSWWSVVPPGKTHTFGAKALLLLLFTINTL